MVSPNDAGYEKLIADIFATMKTATEMNTGYRTPEEVHEYMGGAFSANRSIRAPPYCRLSTSTTASP